LIQVSPARIIVLSSVITVNKALWTIFVPMKDEISEHITPCILVRNFIMCGGECKNELRPLVSDTDVPGSSVTEDATEHRSEIFITSIHCQFTS
jgi:hypothetical protein